MSVGIRSRTERPAYEETSEHFHVGVALPWSAEEPNAPLSSPALARHVRPHTRTVNTGASGASVMREDRDGVGFSHGTLSMITGASLRGPLSLTWTAPHYRPGRLSFVPGSGIYKMVHATLQQTTWAAAKTRRTGCCLRWIQSDLHIFFRCSRFSVAGLLQNDESSWSWTNQKTYQKTQDQKIDLAFVKVRPRWRKLGCILQEIRKANKQKLSFVP